MPRRSTLTVTGAGPLPITPPIDDGPGPPRTASEVATQPTKSEPEVSSRPPADGWQRRRERISLEIERAALELFADSSPDDVTIDRIAAAAGISNRTFFRYFATRDEVLAALPRRALGRLSELVRARPASESVLQAFMEAEHAGAGLDPSEHELALLWGIVVERSPLAANKALAHSAVSVRSTYQQLIAERTAADPDDPEVGAMAAAIAGVISYTFGRWLRLGGTAELGPMIADALTVLKDIDRAPTETARNLAR